MWHGAQVRERAVVGDDCTVGKDAYVDADVRVGDRVKIQNGVLLYRGVTVESGVFLGPGAIVTNDRLPRAITPQGGLAGASDWSVTPTRLSYGCSIGAGAIVVAGSDVGRFAMVGAGAVVTRPVADHALVAGNPARPLGWVCTGGARLVSADGRPVPSTHTGDASCAADGLGFAIDASTATCRPITAVTRALVQ